MEAIFSRACRLLRLKRQDGRRDTLYPAGPDTAVLVDAPSDGEDLDLTPCRHTAAPGFQIMSDLHLEKGMRYNDFVIPPRAPYLVLAGDIGCFRHKTEYLSFLCRQCEAFEHVFLVPGNHEFYHISRAEGLAVTGRLHSQIPHGRVTLMDKQRVDLDEHDTVLLGCTLHSHIPDDYTALTNDFQMIEGWRVADHNREHQEDLAWLEQELALIHATRPQSRVIVITHYAPVFDGASHSKHQDSPLRSCFCSDALRVLVERRPAAMRQVSHWVFGHTHYNARFRTARVELASNTPNDEACRRKFDIVATI